MPRNCHLRFNSKNAKLALTKGSLHQRKDPYTKERILTLTLLCLPTTESHLGEFGANICVMPNLHKVNDKLIFLGAKAMTSKDKLSTAEAIFETLETKPFNKS